MAGAVQINYEPSPRYWHLSTSCQGKVLLWGGLSKDFVKMKERAKLASVMEIFDPNLRKWEQKPVTGALPPGLYAGASSSMMDTAYAFGGTDGINRHNSLHQLKASSMEWSELKVCNPQDGPMKKSGCVMVSYNDDTIVLFGGFGIPSSAIQSGSSFIKDTRSSDGRGWTNELHLFNIKEGIYNLCTYHGNAWMGDIANYIRGGSKYLIKFNYVLGWMQYILTLAMVIY